ncbi:hypothetical protein [Flavobacterium covae]
MRIILKINYDANVAIIKLMCQMIEAQPMTKEAKLVQSIIFETLPKFQKAKNTAIENQTVFIDSKKNTVTLKYHQAYALEQLIINLIFTVNCFLAKKHLNDIKDFLNQKLA